MTSAHRGASSSRTPVRLAALWVGVVFLLIGGLGFVPGVTSGYDTLAFADHESDARLLGLLHVSILHNVVHLVFGAVALVTARTPGNARPFLLVGGLVYLALSVYGVIIDLDSESGVVPVNTPDTWLHFAFGATMVALGLLLPRPTESEGGPGPGPGTGTGV
ncbi:MULTISPECIES: DUF4383 domain-containing protein [Streptomyces]|uniref:DUF4383 domain-containing protein n=2 Tax=Streptomyces TaxID=1883 RepID=A0A100Y9Q6_9ACTN|nr:MULTISPECIES: DUF4383 domain-containing protein [Streptomyces]KUH40246.1 hypothetical protein ATE80_02805 [Streptomyces kanasensis]UUS34234.1 DUF4383 domain-containing protein [Streptomyces changanensis]